jgi:rod shape-determining protein MreD
MNSLGTIVILLTAFLVVFLESSVRGLRLLLGAQIDLLPALMTYTALSSSLVTVTLLAICAGLWFDALSANPLGITILPLFVIGALLHQHRDLLLRDQITARSLLGLAASAALPVLVLLLLLATGHRPLIGWSTLWQCLVMAVAGALVTPLWFALFHHIERALHHPVRSESSFRPDREIQRGR